MIKIENSYGKTGKIDVSKELKKNNENHSSNEGTIFETDISKKIEEGETQRLINIEKRKKENMPDDLLVISKKIEDDETERLVEIEKKEKEKLPEDFSKISDKIGHKGFGIAEKPIKVDLEKPTAEKSEDKEEGLKETEGEVVEEQPTQKSKKQNKAVDNLLENFEKYDTNEDGVLSSHEIIAAFDKDGNGVITQNEENGLNIREILAEDHSLIFADGNIENENLFGLSKTDLEATKAKTDEGKNIGDIARLIRTDKTASEDNPDLYYRSNFNAYVNGMRNEKKSEKFTPEELQAQTDAEMEKILARSSEFQALNGIRGLFGIQDGSVQKDLTMEEIDAKLAQADTNSHEYDYLMIMKNVLFAQLDEQDGNKDGKIENATEKLKTMQDQFGTERTRENERLWTVYGGQWKP